MVVVGLRYHLEKVDGRALFLVHIRIARDSNVAVAQRGTGGVNAEFLVYQTAEFLAERVERIARRHAFAPQPVEQLLERAITAVVVPMRCDFRRGRGANYKFASGVFHLGFEVVEQVLAEVNFVMAGFSLGDAVFRRLDVHPCRAASRTRSR